jgi:hypothetical protein
VQRITPAADTDGMRIRASVAMLVTLAALATTQAAQASQIIGRGVRMPSIAVMIRPTGQQVAEVTFYQGGLWHHTLVWGAINARKPDPLHPMSQVKFSVDYSGGYGSFGTGFWKKVKSHNVCHRYAGQALPWRVAGCTMPDGSNWALQAWQRALPDMGIQPTALRREAELHVSHWSGPLPILWMKWGWSYRSGGGHYDHLYGQLSYLGNPVYGFSATHPGTPLDPFGRNIYVDTQDPNWHGYRQPGGWYRWNGFLTHRTSGDFCASVYGTMLGITQPVGAALAYRAYVEGPGVTPVVGWHGGPPGYYRAGAFPLAGTNPIYTDQPTAPPPTIRGPFVKSYATELNDEQRALAGPNDTCYTVYGPHS